MGDFYYEQPIIRIFAQDWAFLKLTRQIQDFRSRWITFNLDTPVQDFSRKFTICDQNPISLFSPQSGHFDLTPPNSEFLVYSDRMVKSSQQQHETIN